MKTSRTRIASTIAKKTLNGGSTKEYSQEIAAYLLSEHRVGELSSLLRDVQSNWADNGYVEAIASTSHTLTPEIKKDIILEVKKLYLTANQVTVTEIHNPELIGGVRIALPHQQLDMTVRAKLNKLKQLTILGKD